MRENTKALKELETITKTCTTPAALVAGIAGVIHKYGAREVVSKRYPNGLRRIRILDKDGAVVAEYTQ